MKDTESMWWCKDCQKWNGTKLPACLKALQSKLQWDRDEVIKCVSQLQSRGTVRDTGDGFVLMD